MIINKTEEEIKYIRQACRIVADVLRAAKKILRAGITTKEIDAFIENELVKRGAEAAFKGYRGYKHASCLSVNEEVVHGIPSERKLKDGDIIGVDVGSIVNGYYGDVAETFAIGRASNAAEKLIKTARQCLELGIKQAQNGRFVGDISFAIEQHAMANGYNVVKDLFGHGVGRNLHEDPLIPNFGKPGSGARLEKGMVFAIEPMLNMGASNIITLDDGWTVITQDKQLSAHFEHTIAITDGEAEILTKRV